MTSDVPFKTGLQCSEQLASLLGRQLFRATDATLLRLPGRHSLQTLCNVSAPSITLLHASRQSPRVQRALAHSPSISAARVASGDHASAEPQNAAVALTHGRSAPTAPTAMSPSQDFPRNGRQSSPGSPPRGLSILASAAPEDVRHFARYVTRTGRYLLS